MGDSKWLNPIGKKSILIVNKFVNFLMTLPGIILY